MPCLLLFGPTGMGKTRTVQKFLREHRSSFDDVTGRTRLPIVAVQMPPAPSERDLYEELLVSMGAVLPAHRGVTTLRQRTRITARQLEVRMLVIDEIHSILAGTFREQRIVLNAIRFLANDLRIPLVQLLDSFAAILPLRRASELRDPKIRNRVLVLTEGVTVRICRLLEAAAIQAIEKEHELINLQTLTDDLTTETLVSISDRRSRRTN
jgi:Bacterial TniB protein